MNKLKLFGFNNLTKNFSICFYNISYSKNIKDCKDYIKNINKKYNSNNLIKIFKIICSMLDANIINISFQDYEPQGASISIIISEKLIKNDNFNKLNQNIILSKSILAHLDKSHICAHTYPEIHPKVGLCTFRIDIELSTCGIISPLKIINYLINTLKSDVITIDYRVRGFTRDINGIKYYNDYYISSIQNIISNSIKKKYNFIDFNLYQENIFYTKMMKKNLDFKNYIFNFQINNFSKKEIKIIKNLIFKEIKEIYFGINFS